MVRSPVRAPSDVLPKNTATWDRALRLAVAVAILFGLLAWTRNPYLLLAGGILVGLELIAVICGF